MERNFRYAPLSIDQRAFHTRMNELWPGTQIPSQNFFRIVQEVVGKMDPQEAFFIPPDGTRDRGVYLTVHAIYPISRQIDCPIQGVAFIVMGIPFNPEYRAEARRIVESRIPLEEVNKNLQLIKGLSPNSKRLGKIDQVFNVFKLVEKEQEACYLPRVLHRGHIAIYNHFEGTLDQMDFGVYPEPVTTALRRFEDVLSGLGSLHRADVVHGSLSGRSCSVDFVYDLRGEKGVSLSHIHLASKLGEVKDGRELSQRDYFAPWIWKNGLLGQVRGELVSPTAIDKANDLYAFGRMVQFEIMKNLFLYYGNKLNVSVAPFLAQYFFPQRILPWDYSAEDLLCFERENPGRVQYQGTDNEGKIHLTLYRNHLEVFEKTGAMIDELSASAADENDKRQLQLLKRLTLFVRDLSSPNFSVFVFNFLGQEGLIHNKENERDRLVKEVKIYVGELLGFSRPDEIPMHFAQLEPNNLNDPIESGSDDEGIISSGEIYP